MRMKYIGWAIALAFLILLIFAVPIWYLSYQKEYDSTIAIAAIIGSSISFLGVVGLIGWNHWLARRVEVTLEDKMDSFKTSLDVQDNELKELRGKLASMEASSKPFTDNARIAKNLLDLAEKLRVKITAKPINGDPTTTKEEVPDIVRDYILEVFKTILSPAKDDLT